MGIRVEFLSNAQVDDFFMILKNCNTDDGNIKIIYENYLRVQGVIKEKESLNDVICCNVIDDENEGTWFAEIIF